MAKESSQQPYDNLLKRLLEGQPTTIIPLLLDDDNLQITEEINERLRDEMLCFKVLLERAKRLPDESLQRVLRRIHMFDPLLEQDPWVQELRAQDYAKGRIEGQLLAYRYMLTTFVRDHFPSLSGLAEAKAAQVDEPDKLASITAQISTAGNEQAARKILESLATS